MHLTVDEKDLQKLEKGFKEFRAYNLLLKDLRRPLFLQNVQVKYIVKPVFLMRLFSLKGIHCLNALPQTSVHLWLFVNLMKRCKNKTHPTIYNKQSENNALVIRG